MTYSFKKTISILYKVHLEDLIEDPDKEIRRWFKFLDIECSDQYIQACHKM